MPEVSRAAQLWALLHNDCPPHGRWTKESQRYYEAVAAKFDNLPPRVKAAEDRQHFRDKLSKSSLGEPDVVAAVEQFRRETQALPDRWVSLRRVDFIGLIELYRERREVHNEDHDDALDYLLAEVDFEPNQDDLFDRRNRLD